MKKLLTKILYKIYHIFFIAHQLQIYSELREKYNIDDSFIFNGNDILMYGDGEIIIRENTYIGRNSVLQSSKGCRIYIGQNCKIGPFFSVWTQTAEVDCDFNSESIAPKFGNIIINDGVWIGTHVYISPGITVGENSIIGANSVITKDVPPYAIMGGVPAKILRFKNITKTF